MIRWSMRGRSPRIDAHRRRQAHRAEGGLTLIESLVTIAVMSVGVVGIGFALAETEQVALITQDQSQLEVAMRQLSDFVRDSTPSTGLTYQLCATAAAYNSHLPSPPSGVTAWSTSAVYLSTSGTRNLVATAPIKYCVTQGTCTDTKPCDWGVQEIVLSVSHGTRSLSRTIWKSQSW